MRFAVPFSSFLRVLRNFVVNYRSYLDTHGTDFLPIRNFDQVLLRTMNYELNFQSGNMFLISWCLNL
jgi:hypothetical protein